MSIAKNLNGRFYTHDEALEHIKFLEESHDRFYKQSAEMHNSREDNWEKLVAKKDAQLKIALYALKSIEWARTDGQNNWHSDLAKEALQKIGGVK